LEEATAIAAKEGGIAAGNIGTVTAHEHDFKVRLSLPKPVGELASIHFVRHNNVRQQQVDFEEVLAQAFASIPKR
jgi:hypothetical protein